MKWSDPWIVAHAGALTTLSFATVVTGLCLMRAGCCIGQMPLPQLPIWCHDFVCGGPLLVRLPKWRMPHILEWPIAGGTLKQRNGSDAIGNDHWTTPAICMLCR